MNLDKDKLKKLIPDEVVVRELMKDAKRFKSKWELNTAELSRSKPNTKFLERTLNNVVKTNNNLMRKPIDEPTLNRKLLEYKKKKKSTDSKKRLSTETRTKHCSKSKRRSKSKSKHRSQSEDASYSKRHSHRKMKKKSNSTE